MKRRLTSCPSCGQHAHRHELVAGCPHCGDTWTERGSSRSVVAASLFGLSLFGALAACGGAQQPDDRSVESESEGDHEIEVVEDVYGAPPEVDDDDVVEEGSGETIAVEDQIVPLYGLPPVEVDNSEDDIEPIRQPLYGAAPGDW